MRKGLAALFLCLTVLGWSEEQVYRSNSIGMRLERIAPWLRNQSQWVLTVDTTPTTEVRRLWDDGRETRRWEAETTRDGRVEKELRGKTLAARRSWDARGNLLEEEEYANGALARKTVMGYVGGKLRRARVLGPDGNVMSTVDYLYASNGALRRVTRTTAAGAAQVSSAVAGPSGVSEQRDTAGADARVARFDAEGHLIDKQRRSGDTLVDDREMRYRPETGTLESATERDDTGAVIEESYDDGGRIVSRKVSRKDTAAETTTWTRDTAGRATAMRRESAAGVETWSYTLGADGAVAREEYSSRGVLRKVTTWGPDGTRAEELYSNGSPFLKVYYRGDTRIREEVYRDGAVIRERTFQ